MPGGPLALSHGHPAERSAPPIVRETIRAAVAFGLYIVLLILDSQVAAGKVYWAVIAALTRPFLEWTRHFEGLPSLASGIPENQHSHLALLLALFLVSLRMPLARRVRYFGVLLALALAQDIVAAGLSMRLHEAKELYEQHGWVMLLPWEYDAIQDLWYLVYAVPLQGAPFLLILLTAFWNAGTPFSGLFKGLNAAGGAASCEAPTPGGQRRLLNPRTLGVLGLVSVAGIGWACVSVGARIRERNPLHLRTHLLLGNARLLEGEIDRAEREYVHVLEWDAREGEAWVRLAQLHAAQGEREEAVAILRKAAGIVPDGLWRDRIQTELEALGSSDPIRIPAITSVEPATVP